MRHSGARARPSRRLPVAAHRAMPVVVGAVVIALLAAAAILIGDASLRTAERDRLGFRRNRVQVLAGAVAKEQDPAATVTTLEHGAFDPEAPVVDQRVVDRLRVTIGSNAITLTALVGRDGRTLSALPADGKTVDVRDLGTMWDQALLGLPGTTNTFRYGDDIATASLFPVGDPSPWAVLVVVELSSASQWQTYTEQLGSGNLQPGGIVLIDREGIAVSAWDRSLIGDQVLTPEQVAALPLDESTTWVSASADHEVTGVGQRLPSGFALLFQQETTMLYGDLRDAQGQRNLTLLSVLGVALAGLVVFQVARERTARRAESRLHSLLKNSQDLVVVTDPDGSLSFISPAIEDLLGHQVEHWQGRPITELSHPDDAERLDRLGRGERSEPELNVRLHTGSGEHRWFDVEASDLRPGLDVAGTLLTCHEIGQRRDLQEQLSFQATHDALTGLPDRREFTARLEAQCRRAPRRPFALIYLDLDHFKAINDRYGHAAGDEVLKVVAQRVRAAAGDSGYVCRFGGDEFGILLDGAGEREAIAITERLLKAARSPVAAGPALAYVDASLGIALASADVELGNPEQLVRQADQAMYQAKHAGRGRYAFATGLSADAGTEATCGASALTVAAAPPRTATPVPSPPAFAEPRPAQAAPPRWPPRPWCRRGLAGVAPLLAAGAIVVGVAAVGYLQSASQQRTAEEQRVEETKRMLAADSARASLRYDPQRTVLVSTSAPWTLDGSAVDQAITTVFQTSPAVGRDGTSFLMAPDGRVLTAAPAGARNVIDTRSRAWQDALEGRVGVAPIVQDPDQIRSYYLTPVVRDGRTAAIVAVGASSVNGPYQEALEGATRGDAHHGIQSIVDQHGVVYASGDRTQTGTQIVDPAELARIPQRTAAEVSAPEGTIMLAAPEESFAGTSAPTYGVYATRAEDLFADLRVGRVWRGGSLAVIVLFAVAGLTTINHRREQALRRSEAQLDALLHNAHDVVAVLGGDGRATFVSSAVGRLLGDGSGIRVGAPFADAVHADDRARVEELFASFADRRAICLTDIRIRDAGGRYLWFDVDGVDLRDQPEVGGVLLTCHEVSRRKELQDQLAHQARHDALTDLPNRAALTARLDHLAVNDPRGFAVLFVDLDHFKPVNDIHGHDVGDLVLQVIADRLTASVRSPEGGEGHDLVSRLGGDEFAIVLLDADEHGARATAARILDAARTPIPAAGTEVRISATIGIALSEPGNQHPDQAVRNADIAMYNAKEAGRDGYAIHGSPSLADETREEARDLGLGREAQ